MSIKKIITHDARFHTDESFACALFGLYFDIKKEPYEIIYVLCYLCSDCFCVFYTDNTSLFIQSKKIT